MGSDARTLRESKSLAWAAVAAGRVDDKTVSAAISQAAAQLQSNREVVMAAISQDAMALEWAAEELQGDRQVVLAAVSKDGRALQWAPTEMLSDRELCMAAVMQQGVALEFVAAELRSDRELVIAAVSNCGKALQYAAAELMNDREVVMAAVSTHGQALKWAAAGLRSDRELVMAATSQDDEALMYADDALLEDEAFAVKARQEFCFFKIVALSGHSCIVLEPKHKLNSYYSRRNERLVGEACQKLNITRTSDNSVSLLYGAKEVPWDGYCGRYIWLSDFPGHPSPGKVVEYQLVMTK